MFGNAFAYCTDVQPSVGLDGLRRGLHGRVVGDLELDHPRAQLPGGPVRRPVFLGLSVAGRSGRGSAQWCHGDQGVWAHGTALARANSDRFAELWNSGALGRHEASRQTAQTLVDSALPTEPRFTCR